MSHTRRFVAAVAGAVLWAAASTADYRKAYGDGLAAARNGEWAQVAALMRQAIAERSQEGERIRLYGTRFETYLPYFYLGQALAESGDCAGALEALQTSENQGAVKSTDKYVELQRLRGRCQRAAPGPTRPAAQPTPDLSAEIRRAEQEVSRATELEKAVAELRRSAAAVWQEMPALAARVDRAANTLGGARNALARGKAGAASELGQAAALAAEAARELEAVRAEVASRQGELRQAAAAEQARQEEARRQAAAQELANLLRTTQDPAVGSAGSRAEVKQALDALQQARGRASRLGATASADELLAAKAELEAAEKSLRERLAHAAQVPGTGPVPPTAAVLPPPSPVAPTPGAPPSLLRQAAGRYLAADYRGVLELLAAPASSEPRAAAAAALLRAAASWALYVEEGEADQTRLQAARTDIQACKRLQPSLAPDPGWFPPGFVELFGRTR